MLRCQGEPRFRLAELSGVGTCFVDLHIYTDIDIHIQVYMYKQIWRNIGIYEYICAYMKDVRIPCVLHERRKMAPLKDVRILDGLHERRAY